MRPPGDHILLIYEDTPELVTFVASFIEEGLSAGQRCLCVPYAPELPDITRALAARGIDVERECRRGALVFMDAAKFAGPPPFDPRRMVELLHNRVMDSEVRGFGGLRVAADATWTASAGVSPPALSE